MTKNGQEPCVSAPAPDDEKTIATLRAHYALLGHELHVVRKGDVTYYEARLSGQCQTTCSTLHDLRGFLAQIGGVP